MTGPTKHKNEIKRQALNFHLSDFNLGMDLQVMLVTLPWNYYEFDWNKRFTHFSSLDPLSVSPKYRHSTLSVGNHFIWAVVHNSVIFVPFGLTFHIHDAIVPLPTAEMAFWNWNFIHFRLKTINKSYRRSSAK